MTRPSDSHPPAAPQIFPVRANTEILVLDDVAVDFEVRIRRLRQARHSIDIITLSQAMDEVGTAFLGAIHEVQAHHQVRVRFLYDRLASLIDRDFANASGHRLADANLQVPGQVIGIRLRDKLRLGLAWDDFFHQKLILIDAGTPGECCLLGGRGYTKFTSLVADSGYLIRPLDPTQPYLGTDLLASFENIWELANRLTRPLKAIPGHRHAPLRLPVIPLTADQVSQVDAIERAWVTPGVEPLPNFQFRPRSLQLTSSERIRAQLHAPTSSDHRSPDPNTHAQLEREVRDFTGTIDLSVYGVGFPPSLLQAFATFVQRGQRLRIWTNGREANRQFVPGGLPVFYTTETLVRLLDLIGTAAPNLEVWFLNPKIAATRQQPRFLHRKLVVLRHTDGAVVYTGTDNFTWSAACKNDEWMVRIEDPRLADQLVSITNGESRHYDQISAAQICALHSQRPIWYQPLRKLIRNNY